jgi:Fe(3+) dicitrate transport protein
MKLKAFNILLLLFYGIVVYAQDSIPIKNSIKKSKFTDTSNTSLKELVVSQKQTDFGFTRMRAVEQLGIYEGKKTEVIILDQLVANLATNNARQVFAKVAGLNIWENDGAGLQLSIGGRGLDPNRSSNFNVRQNGYDISADALGYPESYYTPPLEAVSKIQIVRGAASLQYGTQFGGLINFVMKKPVEDKKIELLFRQSVGSFGFYNAFTSIGGTYKKLSYYSFFQYKKLDGWRPNSELKSYTFYTHFDYHFSKKTTLGLDYTHMNYLTQQAGGLSDAMFNTDPRQSNRERNWFDVNWNLFALHYDYKLNASNEINIRLFGLLAHRYSVGFRPNRVATIDNNGDRDLIKGDFKNYGAEARYLKRYYTQNKALVFLAGARYYNGYNHSVQGIGSKGKDANFNFVNTQQGIESDYNFPNQNVSLFIENIIYVSENFSITPGLRFEYIHTNADGYYKTIFRDLAGNIISTTSTYESRVNGRRFLLGGIGFSYKPKKHLELYANVSQNYRSITFSDMRINNPSQVIDPNLKDERGYSVDLGIRTNELNYFTLDVSGFLLSYNNRIGEVQYYDVLNRVLRLRTNIGAAIMMGIESYIEGDLIKLIQPKQQNFSGVIFLNLAGIYSQYTKSEINGIVGNQVEFVPNVNLKTGVRFGYKKVKTSFQLSYLSDQFSDATNAIDGGYSAVVGFIPAYYVMDASLSYQLKKLKFEVSLNNLSNNMYFTRRATGYPGPGIIPSDGRAMFLTIAYKI